MSQYLKGKTWYQDTQYSSNMGSESCAIYPADFVWISQANAFLTWVYSGGKVGLLL